MSEEKVYPVPKDVADHAWADETKYRELYIAIEQAHGSRGFVRTR